LDKDTIFQLANRYSYLFDNTIPNMLGLIGGPPTVDSDASKEEKKPHNP
jgi:hypothetical protein